MGIAKLNPGIIRDIRQLDPDKRYSYADYLKWQFDEYVELIKGKLFQKMSQAPAREHQRIVMAISGKLFQYLTGKPCDVYPAPFDVRFPSSDTATDEKTYTVVQPDISLIRDPSKLDDRGCVGAPDMIVEVVSRGTAIRDWNFKYNLYQETGVKEYWIIEPVDRSVTIFILTEENKYLQTGVYAEETDIPVSILPGFSIKWGDIFNTP
ncbi:Uma2 family endonuclease [Niabella drilacis]|uniref:Endonuclease, Uma2 family (Restriction endonuclease fold) n=1 Tax=Niabella drilacis (strain DSM 25811 / CCM 8410 / CCUG 62505 / LMG 26954 / E90) TaxID=1285928 RepID=A0A1G7ADM0_NIADE|nr:Uma2 family endonuclease [Niabella drilacis]SDE11966.1 Endonuclease, Uma2 family (restriction endonuclease fold) [Niabella drilacis]